MGSQPPGGLLADIVRNRLAYLMALPAFVFVLLFGYLTMPYMVMAFQKFSYRTTVLTAPWIGLRNFAFFFRTRSSWLVTWNTLKLNGLAILCTTIAALTLSVLLSELRLKRFAKVSQSTFLFPHFISWIVASYVLYAFLSTEYGLVNRLLTAIGLARVNWYTDPRPWTAILTLLKTWKGTGIQTVIYLAAITAIDPQLHEAAMVDGARRWSRLWHITLPLLLPVVCIVVLLDIGRIFYGDFAMIYAIVRDNGLLYPTTDVIDTYVYRALRLTGNPAEAMAVGMYQSLVGFVMVYGSNRLVRRFFPEGALF